MKSLFLYALMLFSFFSCTKHDDCEPIKGIQEVPGWTIASSDLPTSVKYFSSFTGDFVYMSGNDGNIYRTIDRGKNWKKITPAFLNKNYLPGTVSMYSEDTGWIALDSSVNSSAYRLKLLYTNDRGNTWELMNSNLQGELVMFQMWDYFNGTGIVKRPSGQYAIVYTADGTKNWTINPDIILGSQYPVWDRNLLYRGRLFIADAYNKIWKVTDSGKSWAPAFEFSNISLRQISFQNDSTFFYCTDNTLALYEHGKGAVQLSNNPTLILHFWDKDHGITIQKPNECNKDFENRRIFTTGRRAFFSMSDGTNWSKSNNSNDLNDWETMPVGEFAAISMDERKMYFIVRKL